MQAVFQFPDTSNPKLSQASTVRQEKNKNPSCLWRIYQQTICPCNCYFFLDCFEISAWLIKQSLDWWWYMVWIMAASHSTPGLLIIILNKLTLPEPARILVQFFCHATLVVLPHSGNNKLNKTHHVQSFDNFRKNGSCPLEGWMNQTPWCLGILKFWTWKPKSSKFQTGAGCFPAGQIGYDTDNPQFNFWGAVCRVLHVCVMVFVCSDDPSAGKQQLLLHSHSEAVPGGHRMWRSSWLAVTSRARIVLSHGMCSELCQEPGHWKPSF